MLRNSNSPSCHQKPAALVELCARSRRYVLGLQTLVSFDNRSGNNFTLLRLIFAASVLIGHSFPITGNGSDPLSAMLLPYTWIGDIAVSGFFAISGYLVSGSIVNRGGISFIISRALRLYPAIIIYCLVSIIVIGPLSIDTGLINYFRANPWNNLFNATLWEWTYNLPYVFPDNPFPGSTNGSTWTLPAELRCYILIFLMGFFGIFDSRTRANVFLLVLTVLTVTDYTSIPMFGKTQNFASPLTFFLVGSLFWVNRSLIPLNWLLAVLAIIAPFIAAKAGLYHYVFPPCLIYLIFTLAYKTPTVDIDRFGDISYGVYIYAWPIQQMVWRPEQSALTNIIISSSIVLPAAYLSWRFVESPAIRIRKRLFQITPASVFAWLKRLLPLNYKPLTLSRTTIISAFLICALVAFSAHLSKSGSIESAGKENSVAVSFYLTDENWNNGIARHWAGFFTPNDSSYEKKYITGRIVQFGDGQERQIIDVRKAGAYINVFVAGEPLDPEKVGRPDTYSVK